MHMHSFYHLFCATMNICSASSILLSCQFGVEVSAEVHWCSKLIYYGINFTQIPTISVGIKSIDVLAVVWTSPAFPLQLRGLVRGDRDFILRDVVRFEALVLCLPNRSSVLLHAWRQIWHCFLTIYYGPIFIDLKQAAYILLLILHKTLQWDSEYMAKHAWRTLFFFQSLMKIQMQSSSVFLYLHASALSMTISCELTTSSGDFCHHWAESVNETMSSLSMVPNAI